MDLGATSFERLLLNHLDHREMVSTMQSPTQRVTLGVVAAHHADDRPIIEIGSALGGSALHLAAATAVAGGCGGAGPMIFSIDPDAPTREIMRFALQREGYGDRVEQVVATSDEAIGRLQHLRDDCGLIFIDGLHTAEAVHRDFRNYAPLVALGGALAFHDVCPALHSVMQAVVEHVLPDTRFSAMCLVDGLLVLERVG
jgi:predicted O-methyltransferase YrrM